MTSGERLATATGGNLITLVGAGHMPHGRHPVQDQPADPGVRESALPLKGGVFMRAAIPVRDGYVDRDGVEIFYEVYGDGEPTVLLLPSSPTIHSRQWKGQIPYLSRHFRVVTFDGRGNGRSGRPTGPQSYIDEEFVADTVAVMDETGTESAVAVVLCHVWQGFELAAEHPERVSGVVAIAPGVPLGAPSTRWQHWDGELDDPQEWEMFNRRFWQEGGYPALGRVLLQPDPPRTSLDQATGGCHRVVLRGRRRGNGDLGGRGRSMGACLRRRCREAVWPGGLSGAGSPRNRGPMPGTGARPGDGPGHGGAGGDARRLRSPGPGSRPGGGEPADQGLRRS